MLPQLTVSDDIKSEISAAVALGQEATVSQGNITHAGWTGAGYIITDPNTGAGAYKISGGGNGGVFQFLFDQGYGWLFLAMILGVYGIFATFAVGTFLGLLILPLLYGVAGSLP